MKISTFGFLTRRGVRNLGKHWAMTIACIASLSVCMTLNTFASLVEVNVDSMVNYLGTQNEMVVYVINRINLSIKRKNKVRQLQDKNDTCRI